MAYLRFVSLLTLLIILIPLTQPARSEFKGVTFWTMEVEKDRLEIQNQLAREFEEQYKMAVKVVPIQENRMAQRIAAAYAANSLPDVVYHPLDYTIGWAESGILDGKAATEVIDKLGKATFGMGPLSMVAQGQAYAAVPVDGWGQLLLYRKDLFKGKGLAAPTDWPSILQAAKKLHNPPLLWGFEVATDPGQAYTQQVFEHFALSNGARLLGENGQVKLNTPALVETLKFYKELSKFTPRGNLYWLHTRMDYLSGRAAMIIWSPFILDELSGLRRDQPVVPDQAKGKPGLLASNTGFVTTLKGPHGQAQYGVTNYLGITRDADKRAAALWVEFLLGKGYVRWLSMAPEGKMPMRKGTSDSPLFFVDKWKELEFGVTTRARISDFYGEDTVKDILSGVDGYDRWGFGQGQGALVAKVYGTKVIARILKRYLDGEMDAEKAAALMEKGVKALE